jgi:hypothetical protein
MKSKTLVEDRCVVPLTSYLLLSIKSPYIFGAPSDGKNVLRGVQNRIPHCVENQDKYSPRHFDLTQTKVTLLCVMLPQS